MGSIVQLAHTTLEVQPGRTAQTAITVRNTGSVVDRFTFEAIGDAAAWITFAPDTLSLFPEATGTVNVIVSPPRLPSVTAGPMPFGIKVVSAEDPSGTVVEEATLNVGAFSDVTTELLPRIVSGRRMALSRMAVDNRSNVPYRAEVIGSDPASALMLGFNPAVIEVPPGEVRFVRIRIRPRQVFWRGPSVSKQFRVSLKTEPFTLPGGVAAGEVGDVTAPIPTPVTPEAATAPHPPEINTDGSLMQSALLPRWVMALIAAIVALAVLLVILWFALFKPAIRSTAKDQVKSQLAAAGIPTGSSSSPSGGSPSGGSSGGGSSGSGSGGGSGGGSSTATTVAQATVSTSGVTLNGSLQGNGNGTQTLYTVPSGFTLNVTDLLVQNAAGDTGTLAVARDGTVLMQWAMANFRDLDYHWIAPTVFGPGTKLQMVVSGCTNACHPGVYYAGNLIKAS